MLVKFEFEFTQFQAVSELQGQTVQTPKMAQKSFFCQKSAIFQPKSTKNGLIS